MDKRVVTAIVCVLVVVCLIGYNPQKDSGSTLPDGVCESEAGKYYIVEMPDGKKVTNYLSLTGEKGMVVCGATDANSYHKDLGTIYYQRVVGGGWVAYTKSKTGRFLYMPAGFSEDRVMLTSGQLAMNIANNSKNCMSIDEAKEYIPGIRG